MRQRLKDFTARMDLKISFLHERTGISTKTLHKLLKTDLIVRPSIITKLANHLVAIGFNTVDFEGLIKVVKSHGFTIEIDALNSATLSVSGCEDEVTFNQQNIKGIWYTHQESCLLFCDVDFFNGSRILFRNRNFKVKML